MIIHIAHTNTGNSLFVEVTNQATTQQTDKALQKTMKKKTLSVKNVEKIL